MDTLRKILLTKNADDSNLYNHILKIINHAAVYSPHNALAKFEEISCLLKNKNKYAYEEFLKMDLSNHYSKSNEQTAKSTANFIKSAAPYFPANPLPA